jgi:ribosomal protein S18 acetylase RimI-like enzyme
VTCGDWRDAGYDEVRPLYASELARWRDELHWDLQSTWDIVESARASGRLPGLLAKDAGGAIEGWAFYLLFDGLLQIGGLAGRNGTAVRSLLDGILATPEAELAHTITCFVYPTSSSLASALTRQRFDVQRFQYLVRDLRLANIPDAFRATPRSSSASPVALRPWSDRDAPNAVRLLAQAYEGVTSARCYAPHARLEEWARYLGQLLRTPACGVFVPTASFVVEPAAGGVPLGFILATALSGDTAHIAQVAVSGNARGLGLGRSLVDAACSAARAQGFEKVTLLVAEHNAPARSLYKSLGFGRTADFVFASKGVSRVDRPAPRLQAAAL